MHLANDFNRFKALVASELAVVTHRTNVKKRRGVRWLPQFSPVVGLRLDDGVELDVLRRHGT